MAYTLFYFTAVLIRPALTWTKYIRVTVSIPLLGVLFALPWLIRILPLVHQIDVHERQFPQLHHLAWLLQINGVWVPILATLGLFVAARRRHWLDVWSVTWLLSIIEVSSLGNLDNLSRQTALDPMQVFYPFGVAWHATVIPLSLLAARALYPLGCWFARIARWERVVMHIVTLLLVVVGMGVAFRKPIATWSKSFVKPITGAVASEADTLVYNWIRANTPRDARLLNYPGSYEGQWAPVIAERQSVFFRDQLFYIGAEEMRHNKAAMVEAYLDPNSQQAYDLMRRNSIDYVVVPQALSRPELLVEQLRWRSPDYLVQRSWFADAPYQQLVADFDGAQIWQLKDSSFGSE